MSYTSHKEKSNIPMLTYIKIYSDFIEVVRELDNGARGRLFMAILQYANDEEPTDLTGAERIAFITIKSQINRERDAYADVSEKRRIAGQNGAKKRWDSENSMANAILPMANDSKNSNCQQEKKRKDKEKKNISPIGDIIGTDGADTPSCAPETSKKRNVFQPPTVEEVEEYCRERNNSVSAEKFIDHYTSNGWKVGKNPMKDWKAAVRTWEKSEYESKPADPVRESSFNTDDFFEKALAKSREEMLKNAEN